MSSIIKGITDEQSVTKTQPEVQVPGYGTMPLDMLKRHVQSLSKDFNDSIQKGEFLKAAYRTEQFYNALMALAKAMKQQNKVDETHSTGTTVGSAGIGGGVGLGIDKSPIEKVIEKPLGEGELPPKAGFNKKPHKVGPGTSKDDYEYKSYIPRDRKEKGEEWAIARDVRNVNSKLGKKKPKELDTGFYKSYLSNRPVREGEVVSMQARKTPLVLVGRPFDWDIYDLRTNKVVANLLGGDRHDSPLYEIRINRNGIDKDALMKPTYVATGDANSDGPHNVYELEVPSKVDKIEKSPGPGGTTKLRPDNMDMLGHMAKQTGQGKYYGYDLVHVSDDDAYTWIEKVLGAKIMDVDDAMEAGYTDVDPEDPAGIIYTGDELDESLPTSPGGMGQSYRKFTPKSAGVAEGADLDAQAMDIATKLTTGKNLEKLRGMVHDSTVYRALDRYFAKHNIPETIYNRVANIVFKKINQQGVAEGAPELLKQEMPLVRHIERELEQYGYEKGTPEYNEMFKHSIAMYRKFGNIDAIKKAMSEEQAPMFTPEEKIVNINDKKSDGWRVYKAEPAGSKDDIDEVSNFLALRQKDDEYKKIFGTTPLYKEGDKIVTKFSDKTPNVKGVVVDFDPKTKKTLIKADDGKKYFVHAQNLAKVNKESSIMKGIQAENESSKGK